MENVEGNERLEKDIKTVLRNFIDICQVLHHSQKVTAYRRILMVMLRGKLFMHNKKKKWSKDHFFIGCSLWNTRWCIRIRRNK